MNHLDLFVDELLGVLLRRLQEQPDVVVRLRNVLQRTEPTTPAPQPLFLTVNDYSVRLGLSKRTVENLIREGLPLVGRGRRRRVPVREADTWMQETRGGLGAIERRARDDARRSAKTLMSNR